MAEQTKCNEQYDGDKTVRCERPKGHTGAHRGDSFTRPVSVQWPAAQPEAAPAQVARNTEVCKDCGIEDTPAASVLCPATSKKHQWRKKIAGPTSSSAPQNKWELFNEAGTMIPPPPELVDEITAKYPPPDVSSAPQIPADQDELAEAIAWWKDGESLDSFSKNGLKAFINALVVALAAERERTLEEAAKVCDEAYEEWMLHPDHPSMQFAAKSIGDRISALSRTEPEAQPLK